MAANGSIVSSGAGVTGTQIAQDANEEFAELYTRAPVRLGSVSGTNTITASAAPAAAFTAYAAGQTFSFLAAVNNTGAVTLNVNTIGAKNLKTAAGADLVAGQLVADTLYVVQVVDISGPDVEFRLIGGSGGSSGGGGGTPNEYVPFTSSGTFDKGDYPGARCFKVIMQGPGGNGATGDYSDGRGGGAGGAGGQAIKIFNPADLAASITVTINSTKAEFGHTTAVVGNAGSNGSSANGGAGGTATGGDLNYTGESGEDAEDNTNNRASAGGRGGSPIGLLPLGAGGHPGSNSNVAGSSSMDAEDGQGYGSGGGGAACNDTGSGSAGSGAPAYGLIEVIY
jgi:hypothetical protein